VKNRISLLFLSAALALWSGCNFGQPTGGGTGVEGISGQLVDPSGHPVEGAWVKVYPVATPAERQASGFAKTSVHMPVADSVRTKSNGRFNIPGLVDGTYTLVATSANEGNDSVLTLLLNGIIVVGNTNLGIDTLRLSGSASLIIQDGNGPVPGAQCLAAGTPFESVTGADGQCLLKNLPPGSFDIVVTLGGTVLGILGDLSIFSGFLNDTTVLNVDVPPGTPLAPILLSPANGASVQSSDSLFWSRSVGATTYHIQIAAAADLSFQEPFASDSTLTRLSYLVALKSVGIPYRWRVRALNASGAGPWSSTRTFITGGAARPVTHFKLEPTTVALWTFDSISASNFFPDVSGGGNHLPAPSQATQSSSPYGKAVTYNGSKSVITGNAPLTLADHAVLTYEARIWLDEYPSASLWNGGASVMGQYAGLKMLIDNRGRIQAAAQSGNGSSWQWYPPVSDTGVVPLKRWVNVAIAAVRDSSLLYVYIDGVPKQTWVNYAKGAVLRPNPLSSYPFNVGNDGQDPQPFPGRIEEIRISNGLVLGAGLPPLIGPVPGL
jgi:hypothetical protein